MRNLSKDKIDSDFNLKEDIMVSSPSAAAGFVGGSSLSGNVLWEDKNGRNLKEIEADEVKI